MTVAIHTMTSGTCYIITMTKAWHKCFHATRVDEALSLGSLGADLQPVSFPKSLSVWDLLSTPHPALLPPSSNEIVTISLALQREIRSLVLCEEFHFCIFS
jgi:hypothetical protein